MWTSEFFIQKVQDLQVRGITQKSLNKKVHKLGNLHIVKKGKIVAYKMKVFLLQWPLWKKNQDIWKSILKFLTENELEIVLVIDNSESMTPNLEKLGENLVSLLSHIKDKDWRMVFTTVDHGRLSRKSTPEEWKKYMGNFPRYGKFMFLENDGKILNQKVLTKNISQYQQIFKDTITRKSSSECSLPPHCLQGIK